VLTTCRELLDAAEAAIFSVAPTTWRLSNVNPAFTRLLGFPSEEADRLSLDQLLPDSERPPVKRMLTELSTSDQDQARSLTFEALLCRKDSTPRWFSINATRLARSVGTLPTGHNPNSPSGIGLCPSPEPRTTPAEFDLLLVCNDTSVSRKVLTELEQTRSFIEGIFAALPCGVAIVSNYYEIIDANPAYFKPLGLDRSQVRSRHCHEALGGYPTPCSMFGESCPIVAARAAGTTGRVYRDHRLPDGRVRSLEYTADPLLDEHGSISAFVLVVNDLTGLRETEQRLEQAKAALEDLNAALSRHHEELEKSARQLELANAELTRLGNVKTEVVSALSQELRTPLAAISEGVGLVEDGSLGALNADQQTFLRLAGKNTKHLTELLDDLLDLSKIEAGRTEVHRHRLDLCRIARDVAATYDSIARDNHQTLRVDLPKDLEPVLADEQSVLRILTNLVGDAVKLTPAGGRITIAADRLPPTADGPEQSSESAPGAARGARIAVSVSDTGIGISGEQQCRLPGKPESASPPGAVRPRGTGLGFALCRRLVEINGGRIWLESEEGNGSRCSFTLPVYTEFAGLAADLHYFASAVADPRNGTPAAYCFRVQPRKEVDGVLPRLEELLDSLLPKPMILSVTNSGCGILAFVPRELPERDLQSIVESLKGSSPLVGKQNSKVRLQFGALDFDQLKLKIEALTAGRSEPAADGAARWWDALFDELKPKLTEVL